MEVLHTHYNIEGMSKQSHKRQLQKLINAEDSGLVANPNDETQLMAAIPQVDGAEPEELSLPPPQNAAEREVAAKAAERKTPKPLRLPLEEAAAPDVSKASKAFQSSSASSQTCGPRSVCTVLL